MQITSLITIYMYYSQLLYIYNEARGSSQGVAATMIAEELW